MSAAAFKAIKVIKYAKKHPNQADKLANFSVMLLSKNQLFGSSAGSDLQAISLGCIFLFRIIYFGQLLSSGEVDAFLDFEFSRHYSFLNKTRTSLSKCIASKF